jgi:hypothetical protein
LTPATQHQIKNYKVQKMSTEQVLTNLEKTIKRVCIDIKKKKGAVGSDKLDALSKLTNSYSRLLERQRPDEKKVPEEDVCLSPMDSIR